MICGGDVDVELGLEGGSDVDLGEDAEALIGQGRAGAFQSLVKRGVDLHAHAEVGQGVLLL